MEDKKPVLGILLPMRGKVSLEWAVEFARLSKTIGVPYKFYLNKHFRIDAARNRLVKNALDEGCEKVLFWDTDIYPCRFNGKELVSNVEAISQLWNHHYPIATGLYWLKSQGPNVSVKDGNGFQPLNFTLEQAANSKFFADGTGLGFCLIDTRVFEKIEEPWFHHSIEEEDGEFLSEDLYFFRKASEAGFKVLCDGRVICKHEIDFAQLTWDRAVEFPPME